MYLLYGPWQGLHAYTNNLQLFQIFNIVETLGLQWLRKSIEKQANCRIQGKLLIKQNTDCSTMVSGPVCDDTRLKQMLSSTGV